MIKFNVVSQGRPWFPYPGRIVGHIYANDEEDAENNLIKSGQLSEKYRGFFKYIKD